MTITALLLALALAVGVGLARVRRMARRGGRGPSKWVEPPHTPPTVPWRARDSDPDQTKR